MGGEIHQRQPNLRLADELDFTTIPEATDALVISLQQFAQQANALVRQAGDIQIREQESYDAAAGLEKTLHGLRKQIEEHARPEIQRRHKAWKDALGIQDRVVTPLSNALDSVRARRVGWETEQERLRREEQRQLEEQERRRLEEQRIAEAVAAEQAGGSPAEVDAVLDAPAPPVIAIAPPTFQKAEGAGSRELWSAEVTSLKELARAVADGLVPEHFIQANETALNQKARAEKQAMNVPGVRAVCRRIGTTRS